MSENRLESEPLGLKKHLRQRRFEDLPASVPEAVKGLPETHPAILEKRPQFETMVVEASDRARVLISGKNSRKIGQIVTKGALKGYAVYTLTLPERSTCPETCAQWSTCYGNAMPFAWRINPSPQLEAAIRKEIPELLAKHPIGILIRLHVLGDFYSRQYVEFWSSLLDQYPRLSAYGYTANSFAGDAKSRSIATAIADTKQKHGRRFAIRWSQETSGEDVATVVGYRVPTPRLTNGSQQGIVCPGEREATACCATCGLCWEEAAKKETIVFIKHGLGSRRSDAIANRAGEVDAKGHRKIVPIPDLAKIAGPVANKAPQMIWVKPTELMVDETYQRSITGNGMRLISKILKGFDWSRFKCPIVCKTADGELFVLDGQHTAIAAATHPDIPMIPVMLVEAPELRDRARSFLGHNRDRITVTQSQIHISAIQAGDPEAVEIKRVCDAAGVRILSMPPTTYKIGDTMALGVIRNLMRKSGASHCEDVLKLLVSAELAPIKADHIRAVSRILSETDIDRDLLADILRETDPDRMMVEAKSISISNSERVCDALAGILIAKANVARRADLKTAAE